MPEIPERTPIADSPLAVVLAARDAEGVIEEVLAGWRKVLARRGGPYLLVVVDDGSRDRTAEHLARLAEGDPQVKVLTHPEPQGFGACLRTALAAANLPLLAYAPADGRYRPEDLRRLLKEIDQVDVVSTCRELAPPPLWWKLPAMIGRALLYVAFGIQLEPAPAWPGCRAVAYRYLVRLLFGLRLADPASEFKLYRRQMLERIPIQSHGDFVHVELLAKANFLDGVMSEVAVSYRCEPAAARPASQVRELFRVLCHPIFVPDK